MNCPVLAGSSSSPSCSLLALTSPESFSPVAEGTVILLGCNLFFDGDSPSSAARFMDGPKQS